MGNGDHRAPGHQLLQRGLHRAFGFAVQGGCGFVQQQDRGIFQHGARDGEALALPAGQHGAAIPHQGAEALRQRLDKIPAAGHLSGVNNLFVGRLRPRIAQIGPQRTIKHRHILRNDGERRAQAGLSDVDDILAIDQHPPRLRVVETLQQCQQGGFTSTRGPNQAKRLPGRDHQIDPVQNIAPPGITESHLLEPHFPRAGAQGAGVGIVRQFMRDQQNADGLFQSRQILDHVHQRDREIARTVQDGEAKRDDQHQIARRSLPAFPHQDAPGDKAGGEQSRHHGMQQAELFEIIETALAGPGFSADGNRHAGAFPPNAAKGPHGGEIANDVHQLSIHRRGAVGEAAMQRRAVAGEAENHQDNPAGQSNQCHRH